jgi:hypothetical protein
MLLAHRGMKISESDWNVFLGHAAATLAKFKVPESEQRDVVAFVQSRSSAKSFIVQIFLIDTQNVSHISRMIALVDRRSRSIFMAEAARTKLRVDMST